MTERCWHGRFTGTQCAEPGRYGNPGYRASGDRPRLNTTITVMRSARWCLAHRHPDDVLRVSDGLETAPSGAPPPRA